jgi:hypothetical protein
MRKNPLLSSVISTSSRCAVRSILLFETRNIEEHWDGKLNDKVVPNDVYMYSITVDDGKGQAIQRSGTLTVLVY